jgi:hypothetical protein
VIMSARIAPIARANSLPFEATRAYMLIKEPPMPGFLATTFRPR